MQRVARPLHGARTARASLQGLTVTNVLLLAALPLAPNGVQGTGRGLGRRVVASSSLSDAELTRRVWRTTDESYERARGEGPGEATGA